MTDAGSVGVVIVVQTPQWAVECGQWDNYSPTRAPTRRGGGLTIAEISRIVETVMATSKQIDAIPKKIPLPFKESFN